MDQKEIDEIVKCISEPRLSKYKKEGELEEYVEIILKNQKIYPALHIMEVIFRNKVHAAVGEILQTKNWLLEYNNGNPSLIKKFSSLKKSKQHKSWWELILFKKSSSEKNDIYEIFNK